MELGRPMLAGLMGAIKAMEDWRSANPDVLIVDVHYKELIGDPIGQAERLYSAFGLPLDAAALQSMRKFLDVNRHGQKQQGVTHRYTLAKFGLTNAIVDDVCGD